jgi:hypothetical protein
MKTKNLIKIMAVLSPMVFAATFSVSALATPITVFELNQPEQSEVLLERVSPEVNVEDQKELQAEMNKEAKAEIFAQDKIKIKDFSIGATPITYAPQNIAQSDMSFVDLLFAEGLDGRAIADKQVPVPANTQLDGRDISNDGEISTISISNIDEEADVQIDVSQLADEIIASSMPTDIDLVADSSSAQVENETPANSVEAKIEVSSKSELNEINVQVISTPDNVTDEANVQVTSSIVIPEASTQVEVMEQPALVEEEFELVEIQETLDEAQVVTAQEATTKSKVTEDQAEAQKQIEKVTLVEGAPEKIEDNENRASGELSDVASIASTDLNANLPAEKTQEQIEEVAGPSPSGELSDAMGNVSEDLIASLPVEEVETLVVSTQGIANEAQDPEELTTEEIAQALTDIDTVQAEATEIAQSLTTTPDSVEKTEIEQKLEKALADLEEAKKSLTEKEAKLVDQKVKFEEKLETQIATFNDYKEEQNKAYCEREDQFADLTAKIEELQNNNVNKVYETMIAMLMPNLMNRIGSEGPRVQSGFDNNFAQNFFKQNNRGQEYGLNMLSLSDLFNARSTGGMNYNVYNIGGDYVGGNLSSNPISGGISNAQQYRYNENPITQYGLQTAGLQDPMRPFSFNFGNNATLDSNRFEQLNNQSSYAHRDQIESNIQRMNEGRNIFNNQSREQRTEVRQTGNGQMST